MPGCQSAPRNDDENEITGCMSKRIHRSKEFNLTSDDSTWLQHTICIQYARDEMNQEKRDKKADDFVAISQRLVARTLVHHFSLLSFLVVPEQYNDGK